MLFSKKLNTLNNSHTNLTLDETMRERRFDMPYLKTYGFKDAYIDDYHSRLSTAPRHDHGMLDLGINGWLLSEDALKLYEMAYFAGDILELGTFMGLSTTVLANAVYNSRRPRPIVTIDLSQSCTEQAKMGMDMRAVPGRQNVHFFTSSAGNAMRTMQSEKRRYSFVFVDASHEYEHVRDTCSLMHNVLEPGGFCLFHDYNDPRNGVTDASDYGVFQGVSDGLSKEHFEFYGIFGCTGLYRLKYASPVGYMRKWLGSRIPKIQSAVIARRASLTAEFRTPGSSFTNQRDYGGTRSREPNVKGRLVLSPRNSDL